MKTTILLPDQLMQKAKLHARKNQMTMTRLIEDALRSYLSAESTSTPNDHWHIEPVGKGGFASPDLEANWPRIRELLYDRDFSRFAGLKVKNPLV